MDSTQLPKETAIQNERQLKSNEHSIFETLSNIEKHLASIAYSLDYLAFDNKRDFSKRHSIPD